MNFTLSFKSGRRLAKVVGGKHNGKIIYLHDPEYKCCQKCSLKCRGDCCDDCGNMKYHNNEDENIEYIKLDDNSKLEMMPTNLKKQSDCVFIVGMRGAGKSYELMKYLKNYKKLYPRQRVYMFSMKKSDELLDDLIDKRVDLDEYVEKGGLTSDDFNEPACVVFDDCDVLPNEKGTMLRTKIFTLMNQLIQVSRSKNITVCQTSHVCLGNEETKHVLNGMSSFTFFSHAVSAQIKACLEKYIGLSKENRKLILDLKNTRPITIFRTAPMVVLTDKEIFILKKS